MNKELFSPAVVTVAGGKVEIEREIRIDARVADGGGFGENFRCGIEGKWKEGLEGWILVPGMQRFAQKA